MLIERYKNLTLRKRILAIVLSIVVFVSTISGAIFTIIIYKDNNNTKEHETISSLVTNGHSEIFTENYNACQSAIEEKDYSTALDKINACISEDSDQLELYITRAQLYYYLEDFTNSYADFNRFITRESTDSDLLLMYIDVNSALGNKTNARIFIDILNSLYKNNSMYLTISGDLYINDNKMSEAILQYQKAFECANETTDKLTLLSTISQSQINLLDYSSAYDTIMKYIDLDETSGQVYYNLGLCCIQLDKYKEGINAFSSSLSLNFETTLSLFQRGLCYYLSDDYLNAQKDFIQFNENNSNYIDSYIYTALSCFNVKDYESADKYFKLCLKNNVYEGESCYYLGVMSLNKENYETSIEYFNRSISKKVEIESSTYNRAVAYLKLEKLDLAKEDFTWITKNSTNSELIASAASSVSDIVKYQNSVVIIQNTTTN